MNGEPAKHTSVPGRRLTRGTVELRGRVWWNRYAQEHVDPTTGVISRGSTRMKLGTVRELRSAAAANAELDRYLALQSAETLQPGPTITAREYFARFDRFRIDLMRIQSRRAYRSIIKNHLEPAFGHLPLSAIDADAVQALVLDLHRKKRARATIETVTDTLLGILKAARESGFAAHTIRRAAIKLPSEAKVQREQRYFTADEIIQILAASSGSERVLWAICAFAGLRIGEALGIEWRHIDLASQTILVRQAATNGEIAPLKTKTSRRDVPTLPQLHQILTDWSAFGMTTGLLFATRTGRPRRADDVRRRWLKPLLKRLGIASGGCHAFRHSLPGRLDALGLSPASIQKWMGHSTLQMTEKYLHRTTADLHEQLTAALDRAGATSAENLNTRPRATAGPAFIAVSDLPVKVQDFQCTDRKPT